MKNFYIFIALCAMPLITSCSKPAINNDPVIGIWSKTFVDKAIENTKSQTEFEWIFNDVFLGRHHRYINNTLTVQTDFQWKKVEDIYTITYPGTDFPEEKVKLNFTTLQNIDGVIFATREE